MILFRLNQFTFTFRYLRSPSGTAESQFQCSHYCSHSPTPNRVPALRKSCYIMDCVYVLFPTMNLFSYIIGFYEPLKGIFIYRARGFIAINVFTEIFLRFGRELLMVVIIVCQIVFTSWLQSHVSSDMLTESTEEHIWRSRYLLLCRYLQQLISSSCEESIKSFFNLPIGS